MLRKLSVLTLIALVLPVAVLAQTTGKIAGQVTDAETGKALIGASVAVADTTLGAATNRDGNYLIVGLPAGTYTILAQFIGFQTQTVDSVEVSPDYTRELNFELTPREKGSGVPSIGVSCFGIPKKVEDNQRYGVIDADGNQSIAGTPICLADEARLMVDNTGAPDLSGGGKPLIRVPLIQLQRAAR